MRTGNGRKRRIPLRVWSAFFAAILLLSGCSTPEYQKVDVGRYTETPAPEADETSEVSETGGTAEEEKAAAGEEEDRIGSAESGVNDPLHPETMAAGESAAADGGTDGFSGEQAETETDTDTAGQNPPAETMAVMGSGPAGSQAETEAKNGPVVTVDAGYQAKGNSEKEPVGPDSETMRTKMSEGSTGTATGVRENELTLTVAMKLKAELEMRGYRVVMTRESNDVNISNAERAEIANENHSDIFIRLHANSMENSGVYGVLTMCMTAQNPYNAGLYERSHRLSQLIVDQICSQTGTKNRGVQEADNSAAINWSKVPVSDVAMGFLSNPDEDRWLQNEGYQEKIVTGIADAVDAYFAGY